MSSPDTSGDVRSGRRAWVGADPVYGPALVTQLRERFGFYDANYAPWLPSDRDARVLDYGCGAGGLLLYLREAGYRDLCGFDLDPRYAEVSRQVAGVSVEHDPDPLRFLRRSARQFDVVVATDVVYYFPRNELSQWLTDLAGVLRPNGLALIEVFNGAGLVGAWPYFNDPWIQTVFSEHSLRWALEDAGLQVEALFDERESSRHLRRRVWLAGRRLWTTCVKMAYVLERGIDPLNPTLFGKKLIAVARRGGAQPTGSTRPFGAG